MRIVDPKKAVRHFSSQITHSSIVLMMKNNHKTQWKYFHCWEWKSQRTFTPSYRFFIKKLDRHTENQSQNSSKVPPSSPLTSSSSSSTISSAEPSQTASPKATTSETPSSTASLLLPEAIMSNLLDADAIKQSPIFEAEIKRQRKKFSFRTQFMILMLMLIVLQIGQKSSFNFC